MDKLDKFKEFIKDKEFLIDKVNNKETTWQNLYEVYDLYGEDEDAWAKFLEEEPVPEVSNNTQSRGGYLEEIINMAKNVDVDKIQEGISSLQKTLGLFGDLFVKNNSNGSSGKEYNPRPLYRRFED